MITVVIANSGRCGTSLCMQMLRAAGVPVFWNREPNHTVINPLGHYEVDWTRWGTHKGLWLRQAEGHAIKLFWSKVYRGLPITHDYQFIELKRDPQNMFDSQTVMLREENRMQDKAEPHRTVVGLSNAMDDVSRWLVGKRHLSLWFNQLQSGRACESIAKFLKLPHANVERMEACIEPSLWHFKPEAR